MNYPMGVISGMWCRPDRTLIAFRAEALHILCTGKDYACVHWAADNSEGLNSWILPEYQYVTLADNIISGD